MSKRPSLADSLRQAVQNDPIPAAVPPAPAVAVPSPDPVDKPSGFFAATRVGKKKLTGTFDPITHKQFKSLAVEREATTEALLEEAVIDLLTKYGVR